MNKLSIGLLTLLLSGAMAHAEKADSLKPTHIQADSIGGNLVDTKGTAQGNVELTRGTLIIRSAKINYVQDPEDYIMATLTAAPGTVATFRQKRDGGPDLWMEGEAERIEYSDKNEVLKLFGRARVRTLNGAKVESQAEGPFISYDVRRSEFTALNSADGTNKVGGGRSEIVIDRSRNRAPAVVSPPPATPAPAAPSQAKP